MLTLSTMSVPSKTIAVSLISCLCLLLILWHQDIATNVPGYATFQRQRQPPQQNLPNLSSSNGKYAYTTFLAAPYDADENSTDEEDHYYIGTRMLLWQLRHDPATRSENGYPFIVLVTADVAQHKRERLEYEGAIVKEVEKLPPLQHETRKVWQDVLTKLRLLEMVEYDLLCFLDSDHVLSRSLDGIFEDPAAQPQTNKNLTSEGATMPDEGPQPSTYVFASNAGSGGFDHKIPPGKGNNLNAGILVFQPSIELFNYHVSLTTPEAETRYNGRYPEQGVWGYAHRRNGNMPWTQLDWKWNINWAVYTDMEAGIASLHVKYWDAGPDLKLRDFALSVKWRMEGYWDYMDETR